MALFDPQKFMFEPSKSRVTSPWSSYVQRPKRKTYSVPGLSVDAFYIDTMASWVEKTIKVFHVFSMGYQGIDQINLNVWSCGIDDLVVEAF